MFYRDGAIIERRQQFEITGSRMMEFVASTGDRTGGCTEGCVCIASSIEGCLQREFLCLRDATV